jgi:hypothetical protein
MSYFQDAVQERTLHSACVEGKGTDLVLKFLWSNNLAASSFQQKMDNIGMKFTVVPMAAQLALQHDGHIFIALDMDLRYIVLRQPFQHHATPSNIPRPSIETSIQFQVWRCCSTLRFSYEPTRCNINNEVFTSSDMTVKPFLIQP